MFLFYLFICCYCCKTHASGLNACHLGTIILVLELIPVGPTKPPVLHLHLHSHTACMHVVWPLAYFSFSILFSGKIHYIVGVNKFNTLRSLPLKLNTLCSHFTSVTLMLRDSSNIYAFCESVKCYWCLVIGAYFQC